MALGRSGRWQALRQFHLQLSHSKMFIPSILLMLILVLSSQFGFSFFFLVIKTSMPMTIVESLPNSISTRQKDIHDLSERSKYIIT